MKPLVSKRKLLAQGDFDGACFLYALANAFICLSGKRPTQMKWDKAIKTLPRKEDFLYGNIGTEKFYEENINMIDVIGNFLNQLSIRTKFKFRVSSHNKIQKKEEIYNKKLINNKSIALLCLDQEHWIIGSSFDKTGTILHVACSSQLTETTVYVEKCDNEFGRPYNSYIKRKNLNCQDTVYAIELIDEWENA